MGSRGLIRSIDVFGVTKPLDKIIQEVLKAVLGDFHIMAVDAALREAQKKRGTYISAVADVLEKRRDDMVNVIDKSIEVAKESEYERLVKELEERREEVDFITEILKNKEITDLVTDIFVDVLNNIKAQMK